MKVGIIGAGHVGLPTAVALAHIGHSVSVYDSDAQRIELLSQGGVPFYEPKLAPLLHAGVATEHLSFTTDPAAATAEVEVAFICVGTPPRATGEANLRAVEEAVEVVARLARNDLVIVEKSTVPAGTALRVGEILKRRNSSVNLRVVCNPEFLREGHAVEDSLRPHRILVGSDSKEALQTMRRLYQPVVDDGARWIATDLATAELAKHASNAFLALKISFSNAVARIAERTDADMEAVADILGADPRIGRDHLGAGLGYGGSCFPKDIAAFKCLADRLGYRFGLLDEIERINDEAVQTAFGKLEDVLWNLEGKRVALLGLSFKPGTDDVRFSPALALARKLLAAGAEVTAYDPQAGPNAQKELSSIEVKGDVWDALDGASCAVLCTEWDEFLELDFEKVRDHLDLPILLDGRNALDPSALTELGFTYLSMGRRAMSPRVPATIEQAAEAIGVEQLVI